jgi:Taurine catabolism dioxygenase TauD, TfdA family
VDPGASGLDDGGMATFTLSRAQQDEVRTAARQAAGMPLAELTPGSFPLPTAAAVLRRLADAVTRGAGFALLRGVPVDEDPDLICAGVGCYAGRIVPQGAEQVPVQHVRDRGADPKVPTTLSYQHSAALGYHADPTDIVALLCVRSAKSGGLSSIVRSAAVHDELARARPDLVQVLYQPWWRDLRTGDGPDSFRQSRDMQFLNNHIILHGRTAYEDYPEPERRRDLIRLWLNAACDAPGETARPFGALEAAP